LLYAAKDISLKLALKKNTLIKTVPLKNCSCCRWNAK